MFVNTCLYESRADLGGGGGGLWGCNPPKHLNFERLTHDPHSQKNTFQTWLW